MRVTCPDCKADFVLPTTSLDSKESTAGCPFCGTAYTALFNPQNPDDPFVTFGQKKVQRNVRTCVECGREFQADESEVVPICPSCQKPKIHEVRGDTGQVWRHLKGGKVVELASDVAVRERIKDGSILQNDELISPDGTKSSAKNFPKFAEAFKAQRTKHRMPQSTAWRVPKRMFHIGPYVRWGLIGIVSLTLGWVVYRVGTFRPRGPQWNLDLLTFVKKLKDSAPLTNVPEAELLSRAQRLMSRDQPDSYEEAVRVLESALVTYPSSCASLGSLAEAYSIVPAAALDLRFRLAATSLGNLALQLCPDEAEGYAALIRTALRAHDEAEASKALSAGLLVAPQNSRLLLARQALLTASIKSQPSSREFSKNAEAILAIDSRALEAYDLLGQAYLVTSEPAEAVKVYEKRLRLSPEDATSLYRLGQLEEYGGNFKVAKEWYREAIRQSSKLPGSKLALALLALRVDDNTKLAERYLREILTRNQRQATIEEMFQTQLALIAILIRTDRSTEALEISQRFPVDMVQSTEATLAKAEVLLHLGRPDEAMSSLKEAIEKEPASAELWIALGVALEAKASFDEAVKSYREAVKLQTKDERAYLNLLRVFMTQSRDQDALDLANVFSLRADLFDRHELRYRVIDLFQETDWSTVLPAAKLFTHHKAESGLSHVFLGLCYLLKGMEEESREDLTVSLQTFGKAALLDSQSDTVRFLAGRAAAALKSYGRARASFDEVLKLNSLHAQAHLWLGASLAELGSAESAKRELTHSSVINDPALHARSLYFLGNVLKRQGNLAEARRHWKSSLEILPAYLPPWGALLRARG